MKVSEMMTKKPFTCSNTDTLTLAAHLMWQKDVGAIVVTEGETPVGMITDRDVCMAAYTQGLPLHQLQVATAASKCVRTVSADESIERAEAAMREWQLRRLPVVNSRGELVGIVTLNDLARLMTKPGVPKSAALTAVSIAHTLSAVCEPRMHTLRSPLSLAAP